MSISTSKLSPLQLELLKVYSFNPSEEELLQVKDLLARFFAHRFVEKVQAAAKEKAISDETLDKWLNEDEQ